MQSVDTLRVLLSQQTAEIMLTEGTYSLGGTQLDISHSVTIRAAPGAMVVLDGEGSSRVFYISGGDVTLSGLSITGGQPYVSVWIVTHSWYFLPTPPAEETSLN